MASKKCMNLMLQQATDRGVQLSNQEAETMVKYFDRQLKQKSPKSQNDIDRAFDVARETVREMRIVALQSKKEALLRAKHRANITAAISKSANEIDGYNAYLTGNSKMTVGSRDSVSSLKGAIHKDYAASFELDLNKKGAHLEDVFRRGTLDEEITMYAYTSPDNRGQMVSDGKVSKEAAEIFNSIDKSNNARLGRKNRAGAYIGDRDDFLVRQSHDSDMIRRAGFDQWKADFLKLVDQNRTFKNLDVTKATAKADIEDYLETQYKEFISGRHHFADETTEAQIGKPSSANIAKKLSSSRKIHFRDGKAAFEYAQKYSRGSLYERLYKSFEYDARNIALLEKLGPNPKLMHQQILDDIQDRAASKEGIVDELSRKFADAQFGIVSGGLDIPARISLAKIGYTTRAIQGMAKLGGAVISAFGDVAFKGATINRKTSKGFAGSHKHALDGLLNRFASKERKQVIKHLKIYTDQHLGEIHAIAGDSVTDLPGVISEMQKVFYKLNLLSGWTQGHKNGMAAVFSNELANYRNVDFDKLPANTKRTLELYNFTADEWSTFRHLETMAADGENFVTPDAINDLPAEVIDPIIRDRLNTLNVTDDMRLGFKDDLRSKLMGLINDSVDEGVVTVGDRERAMMTLGTQKGTPLGEFVRFAGQFKSFPVTVITKQILPQFNAYGGGLKGGAAVASLVVATTGLGYLSGAAKDLLRGKEPKDPKSGQAWIDALVRGGGLGIYGDFLFAEYNRYGQSFQETVLGPSIGTLSDGLALISKTARMKADSKDYLRFIKSNTPFANLFWTEQAVNYLGFYGLMEMADPGYMRRTERRIKREYNQDYWLPPSSSAVRF